MSPAILEAPPTTAEPSARPQADARSGFQTFLPDSDRQMEARAGTILKDHPHFQGRAHWVRFQCRNQCLSLHGRLPSFYLKQLAQEAIKRLGENIHIENLIVVASPEGEICSGEISCAEQKHNFQNVTDRQTPWTMPFLVS